MHTVHSRREGDQGSQRAGEGGRLSPGSDGLYAPPAQGRGGVSRLGPPGPWGPGGPGWKTADAAAIFGLFLGVGGLVQLLASGVLADYLAAAAVFAIGTALTLGLFFRLVEQEDRGFIARVLVAGLLLRVGLSLFLHYRFPVDAIAPDQFTYQDVGWRTLRFLQGEGPKPWQIGGTYEVGYFYWNAFLYRLFGFVPLAPKLINCFLGAWSGLVAYRVGAEVAGRAGARGAALLTLLMPSLILWSTQNLREAAVTLVNAIMLLAMVRIQVRPQVGAVASALVAATLLALLRDYLAWVAMMTLVGSLFLTSRRGAVSRVAVSLLILLVCYGAYQGLGFGADLIETANFESIDAQRRVLAGGGTALAPGVDISTPVRGITFLPVGVGLFLLSPLPWHVASSPLAAMAFPETLVWYLLLGFAAWGAVHQLRTRFERAAPLLLFLMLTFALYGLVEGNAGTAYRHRSQLVLGVLVFASVGLELRRLRGLRMAREAGPVGTDGWVDQT